MQSIPVESELLKRMPSHFGLAFWLAGFNSLALCDFLPAAEGAEKGDVGL